MNSNEEPPVWTRVTDLNRHIIKQLSDYTVIGRIGGIELHKKDFTCNGCAKAGDCLWAWDLYNIEGSCLALK